MRLQTVLCAMAVSAMAASPVTYWSNQNGSGEIGTKAHVFCTVAPGFAGANWNFGSFANDKNAKALGETHSQSKHSTRGKVRKEKADLQGRLGKAQEKEVSR